MAFADHFSEVSCDYARYRPPYPTELFDFLAECAARRAVAWDCATGSGQAAVALAPHFARVVATDASARQVAVATRHPRVVYHVATAEESGLLDASVDLVTVAQGLHWFDRDRFYAEVLRVSAEGGVIAVWSYNLARIDPQIDRIIDHLYRDILGPFWPAERGIVEESYRSIPFPFAEIPAPRFEMEEEWNLEHWVGYLGTWSAAREFRRLAGEDPVEKIRPDLESAWGRGERARRVRWPLALRVGRVGLESDVGQTTP